MTPVHLTCFEYFYLEKVLENLRKYILKKVPFHWGVLWCFIRSKFVVFARKLGSKSLATSLLNFLSISLDLTDDFSQKSDFRRFRTFRLGGNLGPRARAPRVAVSHRESFKSISKS